MKNKRSLLTFGLLALVLVLGVGYAVVSSVDLTISGTASVKNADLKVSFNGETDVSDASKVTATATDGNLSADIAVTNLELGNSVTATYTIKNSETDIDAKILKKSIANDKEAYFQVTTDVDSTAKTVSKGGTVDVTVTVTLIKTPVDTADSTANITVTLSATPEEAA